MKVHTAPSLSCASSRKSRVLLSTMISLSTLLLLLFPVTVDSRSVLGIDFGSLYMKVALVRSGAPLEIVTNMHSKRKTEQMVLFDQKQRFYGADANGLLARKGHLTPATMSELLGRDTSHPNVQAMMERHFPIKPTYNETCKGLTLQVPKVGDFTAEELVAMVLNHAIDISVAYAKEAGAEIPPPKDVCLTVPSFYTQMERKALLDAAKLAGLNVLALIDVTSAAALHFAHDKNFEEPKVMLFYNMGASSVQVSIVKIYQMELKQGFGKPKPTPALQVLAKTWDNTLGGLSWDHVLVEYLADQFNALWQKKTGDATKDIRTVQRPMTKLRLAANKAKHVLSANTEYPVHMDSLHDDVSLHVTLTRTQLEELTVDLLERAVIPVQEALAAANLTTADLTGGVELLGGGMRVPSIQTKLATVLDPVELGLHMNADESMALGAAYAGANVSTAFRVRLVGLTDLTAFPQQISLSNLGEPMKEGDESSGGWTPKFQPYENKSGKEEEAWNKQATLFKANSKTNIKKTIAFTHDRDVHCALDYAESDLHVEGQELALERYEISGVEAFAKELKEEKGLEGKPKVSLQFELSPSGITSLIKAEASLEETYTAEEEIEVDDEDDDEGDETSENVTDADADADTKKDDKKEDDASAKEEAKENETASEDEKKTNETDDAENSTSTEKEATKEVKKPKKKKKIMVEKEKKRVHKKALKVSTYYESKVQPHWDALMEASKAKLAEMDAIDQKRIMLEASKNRVESYMFTVKNKLIDDEESLSTVSTQEQRDECQKLASDTEMWLEDEGYTADFDTMEAKFVELSSPFEKILLRLKESTARPEMLEKMEKKLSQYEELLKKWETSMPQVTEEERETVTERIVGVRANVTALEEEQAALASHEDPAFLSSDLPDKLKPIESILTRLSKKPKPKPKKNATDTNSTAANETDANATEANETDATEDAKETKEDETEDTEATDKNDDDKDTDDEL